MDASAPMLPPLSKKDDDFPARLRVHRGHLFNCFYFPALGGLLYGYDIGAMAMALRDLTSPEYSGTAWHGALSASSTLQGVVVSVVTFGAVLGSLACYQFEAALGRRNELSIASACYAVAAAGQYAAGSRTLFPTGAAALAALCCARLLYGVGVGFAMHGAPSYIAETAPPALRGALVSGKEAMIVAGMLLGYCVGDAFQQQEGGWRYTFLCALPVACIMFGGLLVIPRSPRWLALRGRHDEAAAAVLYVTPGASAAAVEAIACAPPQPPGGGAAALWADPASRLALVAGLGLVVLQQVTGQPSVLYYVADFFAETGLGNGATIGLAAWKLVCTSMAVVTVDAFGRRQLLLCGIWIMAAALCLLTCTTALLGASTAAYRGMALGAMYLYIGGYQAGFGPVTWTVISEVFPLHRRGQALAMATVTNFALNGLVSLCAAPLLEFSPPFTFAVFFCMCCYAIYFVGAHVPETHQPASKFPKRPVLPKV